MSMRPLETPKAFGEERSRDKEARSESLMKQCDSDPKSASPCYHQDAWALEYLEYTMKGGAYAGWRCSGLQGAFGKGHRRDMEARSENPFLHAHARGDQVHSLSPSSYFSS